MQGQGKEMAFEKAKESARKRKESERDREKAEILRWREQRAFLGSRHRCSTRSAGFLTSTERCAKVLDVLDTPISVRKNKSDFRMKVKCVRSHNRYFSENEIQISFIYPSMFA